MVRSLAVDSEPIPGYRLIRILGSGGFGQVWEAEAPGGLRKAIKIAPLENSDDVLFCRELEGVKKVRLIRHPFLVSIERFEITDAGYLVIVMELADMSLADRLAECRSAGLPGIPRGELLGYLREASEALDLMNFEYGVLHLDVKPANLFLSARHVKVADFGLVQQRDASVRASALGFSPPYAPIELFDGKIDATADQYGLAVTYQELLTGARPYTATTMRGLMFQHLRGEPDLEPLPECDRDIVARAIDRDPKRRFTSCSQFLDELQRADASLQTTTVTRASADSGESHRATAMTPKISETHKDVLTQLRYQSMTREQGVPHASAV